MPVAPGRLARAFEQVDYLRSQDRLIGGQSFPRPKTKMGPRHIVFPTYAFSAEKSKKVRHIAISDIAGYLIFSSGHQDLQSPRRLVLSRALRTLQPCVGAHSGRR